VTRIGTGVKCLLTGCWVGHCLFIARCVGLVTVCLLRGVLGLSLSVYCAVCWVGHCLFIARCVGLVTVCLLRGVFGWSLSVYCAVCWVGHCLFVARCVGLVTVCRHCSAASHIKPAYWLTPFLIIGNCYVLV